MDKLEKPILKEVSAIVFDKLPQHDTCWSLLEGIDGKIYTGVCGEITGGMSAYIAAFEPGTGRIDYLTAIADVLGVPAGNGQATHSKVHYSMLQDDDGIIYAATHCTGAPLDDWLWRPWNCWNHPDKFFSGSGLAAIRPDGTVLFSKIILPKEGSRCMALAKKQRRIYGISYPRNHFFVFDLRTKEIRDIGRIGNINPQCIFLDDRENAFTTDDYGQIIKFCPDRNEFIETGVSIPHAHFRNGFHNTVYDVTPDPGANAVWGVTWNWGARLFRYDFDTGRIDDFGKAYGEDGKAWDHIIHDHAGGLVFGPDRKLYFAANLRDAGGRTHLICFDPVSAERHDLGEIAVPEMPCDHIARGVCGKDGCLYLAEVGNTPTRLFKCDIGYTAKAENKNIRTWG
jgi:hypothetical protein